MQCIFKIHLVKKFLHARQNLRVVRKKVRLQRSRHITQTDFTDQQQTQKKAMF